MELNVHPFVESSPLMFAEFVVGSPKWVFPAIVGGTLLTFLVLFNYAKTNRRDSLAVVGVILKLTAIALLAVCLLEPMRRDQRPRPRANLLPVVVDTSQSMGLKIGRESQSWRDRIDENFAGNAPLFADLSQSFETRIYGFDKRLSSAGEVADLRRDGKATHLLKNLEELNQRLQGRPVAGVLLLSDGNGLADGIDYDDLPELDFPVYPVVPEKLSGLNDLRITGTSIRQTNFEVSPITLTVQFAIDGVLTGDVIVRLTDSQDNIIVEEQTLSLKADESSYYTSFQFRPDQVGLRFYRVDVFRTTDQSAFESSESLMEANSSETTLINNTKLVTVDRRSGPYRVLYLAGRPNWEFKFLRRAVDEDAEVELTGLLRMANKEPKFSFRDQAVSGTNPLFQGLGDDAEETAEQYDEPVLVPIGVKQADELASGFPKTEDQLFYFDAMIVDDVEPEFFSQDQLKLIRRFVSLRGGGLMFLGGQEMWAGRAFDDSVLGDLSPVYVASRTMDGPSNQSLGLTREGMLEPWMRLRSTVSEENKRLRSMTHFTSVNEVGSLKPGAYRLATVTDSVGKERTAVAVQRFGRGKVGALLIADYWRWAMNAEPGQADDSYQSWRQMVRWLVGDVPRRTEIVTRDDPETGAVILEIESFDEAYAPLENGDVKLTVRQPNGAVVPLSVQPVPERPGVVRTSFFDDSAGAYVANAEVRSADGEVVGTPSSGWTRQIAGREFDHIGFNRGLMEKIAQKSGGKLIDESNLDRFAQQLNSEKVPVMETWVYPIWHRGWVLSLALGCLCAEWGLRRYRGLA
ncbi:hypothetical protein [Roseiconus lacunae]|uniref:Glutamine amidotransferase domain-containing protein n=1 Tax=Roseiconus lacunae TaxID=2605694 RepID=A0ABT7PCQ7_9BACT|nr:hypothetical protein [Roseiconus lacunae]MDM4014256.1 hypothetical protein [Roseiconus lacunae]